MQLIARQQLAHQRKRRPVMCFYEAGRSVAAWILGYCPVEAVVLSPADAAQHIAQTGINQPLELVQTATVLPHIVSPADKPKGAKSSSKAAKRFNFKLTALRMIDCAGCEAAGKHKKRKDFTKFIAMVVILLSPTDWVFTALTGKGSKRGLPSPADPTMTAFDLVWSDPAWTAITDLAARLMANGTVPGADIDALCRTRFGHPPLGLNMLKKPKSEPLPDLPSLDFPQIERDLSTVPKAFMPDVSTRYLH